MLGVIWIGLAVIIDVTANLLLKYSNGFEKIKICITAVLMSIIVYYFMMQAFDYVSFAVAYTTIGFLGIVLTNIGGILLFKDRLNLINVLGMVLALIAVILLNFE